MATESHACGRFVPAEDSKNGAWGKRTPGCRFLSPSCHRPARGFASRAALLALLGLLTLLSCKGRDDREEIQKRLGAPDEKVVRGTDPFWSEIWYYYDEGVAYEFHRSAPRCGGDRDYYLYAEYIIGRKGLVRSEKTPPPASQTSESILGP